MVWGSETLPEASVVDDAARACAYKKQRVSTRECRRVPDTALHDTLHASDHVRDHAEQSICDSCKFLGEMDHPNVAGDRAVLLESSLPDASREQPKAGQTIRNVR